MFDFKGMINALLRRQAEEEVHDLKSATVWIQELPDGDIQQAQAEIVKTVVALNANSKILVKERIRTILYLDDKAQCLQDALCRDFLQDGAFGRHYLPTILSFWSEMANAYKTCLRSYAQKPARGVADDLPKVTARGLRYYAMLAKWSHIRYLPVDGRIWRNLHRFYLFAETEGFAETQIRLYPGHPTTTSCMQQYLQPLMLQLASPESLLVPQIELVDAWLDNWSEHLVVERQIRPHRQLFSVNLDEPKPGRKLRRNMVDAKYRYWGTDSLIEKMEQTLDQIRNGAVPAKLGLGEAFRPQTGIDLLETVASRWSREGSSITRKHERTSRQKSVQVIQGLQDIIEKLSHPEKVKRHKRITSGSGHTGFEIIGPTEPTTPDSTPELFDAPPLEWQIENESQYGIGAKFMSEHNIALAIGDLVGLRLEEQSRFVIGLVRRIQKNLDGQVYVGVETINQTPIVVKLAPVDTPNVAFAGLYLPEADNGVLPRCLLIPTREHHAEQDIQLSAQGKSFTIKLKPSMESNADYHRVKFMVTAKQGST